MGIGSDQSIGQVWMLVLTASLKHQWRRMTPLRVNGVPPQGADRLIAFVGHYRCRVYLSPEAYIDVGRGSISIAGKVKLGRPDLVGRLGTVGNFCETAQASIFAGMEHQHDLPVNTVFSDIPLVKSEIVRRDLSRLRTISTPFSIGNGVIISSGATLLDGAEVADGVVVGAGAILRKASEPFEIVAGVPATKIRARFDFETQRAVASARWWDFKTEYLLENLEQLQDLAISPGPHQYQPERPAFVVRLYPLDEPDTFDVTGFVDTNGEERPLSAAPTLVREYITLALHGEPTKWVADLWKYA